MPKMLFIQKTWFEVQGPMYISSVLKEAGHDARLIVASGEDDLIGLIKEYKPDLIGFSLCTEERFWALNLIKKIKEVIKVPLILGGPEPTYFPQIIEKEGVDIICRGEGELAVLDLMNALQNRKEYTNVPNLWVKKNGKIIRNEIRSLGNLSDLPLPDRALLCEEYAFYRDYPVKRFITSRGCPFDCTFCCNFQKKAMYKGKGKFIRWRGVEDVINEIKMVRDNFRLRIVFFEDDIFTMKKPWLKQFLMRYQREITLPFICLVRADYLDNEVAALLKESGCISVLFGIESGNEEFRNKVVKKSLKTKDIIRAAKLLHQYNLKFQTFNMLNLPGETLEKGLETVKLNSQIKTTYPWCSVFQPFPGAELTNQLIKDGLLPKELDKELSFMDYSVVRQKDSDKLVNLQKFFIIAVKFPILLPLIKRLVELPPNKFFKFVWLASFGIMNAACSNLTISEYIKFNSRHIKNVLFRKHSQ